MMSFQFRNFAAFTIFIAFVAHQVYTLSIEERLLGDENEIKGYKIKQRQLTPEEEELANEARAEIAQAIENNLVRIFAVVAAQNEEQIYPRQEDDDDDAPVGIVTPNPNVLPQVAQILGAIFSGNLNITRIVDNTVGLVPNLVRNQLQGLVKLITGENVNLSGSTTVSPLDVIKADADREAQVVVIEDETEKPPPAPAAAASSATQNSPTTTNKTPYRVRNRTKRTTTTSIPLLNLGDDELDRLERELRAAATLVEPLSSNKEPRVYAGLFQNVMKNVNMTEVAKAVPNIFKGATQAFTMLENLGVLEALPGADILEDLDLELDE